MRQHCPDHPLIHLQPLHAAHHLQPCVEAKANDRRQDTSAQSTPHEELDDCQGLHAPGVPVARGRETRPSLQPARRKRLPLAAGEDLAKQ